MKKKKRARKKAVSSKRGEKTSDVEKNYRLTCPPKTASGPRPVSYLAGRKFNIASESSKRRAKTKGHKNRIFLSSSPPPFFLSCTLLAYVRTRAHAYIYGHKVLQGKIYGHCSYYYYCYTGEYIFIVYIYI